MNQQDFYQRVQNIDNFFRANNIKTDIIKGESKQPLPIPKSSYNSRGEEMKTPNQIREDYQNALYGFKWYQMPLCRKSIKKKMQFWTPASVVLAWTYGQFIKKKDPTNLIKTLPFKFYMKSFTAFFIGTTIYCFAESLIGDEFCDIESPFYQENQTRLSIAKRIRGQIKKTGDEGIFSSIFG